MPGYYQLPTDIYNPYDPNYGNSNFGVVAELTEINWGLRGDNNLDVRIFFVFL